MCWFTGRASNQLPSTLFSPLPKGTWLFNLPYWPAISVSKYTGIMSAAVRGCDFQIGVGCASSTILWPCWRTRNIMMMMIMTWWIISCAPLWVLHPWFGGDEFRQEITVPCAQCNNEIWYILNGSLITVDNSGQLHYRYRIIFYIVIV